MIDQAHAFIEKFDVENALKSFKFILEKFPKSDKAHFELGYFYYEQGDFLNAEKHLKESISLSSENNCKKYFTLA